MGFWSRAPSERMIWYSVVVYLIANAAIKCAHVENFTSGGKAPGPKSKKQASRNTSLQHICNRSCKQAININLITGPPIHSVWASIVLLSGICNTPRWACKRLYPRRPGYDVMPPAVCTAGQ